MIYLTLPLLPGNYEGIPVKMGIFADFQIDPITLHLSDSRILYKPIGEELQVSLAVDEKLVRSLFLQPQLEEEASSEGEINMTNYNLCEKEREFELDA